MFVIGMDSKVGEKYLGLGDGDGDGHTWNGMEWGEQPRRWQRREKVKRRGRRRNEVRRKRSIRHHQNNGQFIA